MHTLLSSTSYQVIDTAQFNVSDEQLANNCERNGRLMFHSASSHLLTTTITPLTTRTDTQPWVKPNSNFKTELSNLSLASSFSLLKVTACSIHVHEVIEIIHDSNFDAVLSSSIYLPCSNAVRMQRA